MKDESECKCITNSPVHKNRFFYAKLKLSKKLNLQFTKKIKQDRWRVSVFM